MSEGPFLWFYADLRGGRGSQNAPLPTIAKPLVFPVRRVDKVSDYNFRAQIRNCSLIQNLKTVIQFGFLWSHISGVPQTTLFHKHAPHRT